jgi:hypothetical protein
MSIKSKLSITLGLALICAPIISTQINIPSSETLQIIKNAKDNPEAGALEWDQNLRSSIHKQYTKISALVFLLLAIPTVGIITIPALLKHYKAIKNEGNS